MKAKMQNSGPVTIEAHLVVVVDVDRVPVAIAHPTGHKGAHLRGRLTCTRTTNWLESISLLTEANKHATSVTTQKTNRRACGILEHHLSILDLQGDEVMFLVEASVVEEKPAVLQCGEAVGAEKHSLSTSFLELSMRFFDIDF